LSRPLPDAAATARGSLPESDAAAFDRLAGALLASPSAPLGALLRSQLPGTSGVRWLRQENLPPTTRPTALDSTQWLALFECWNSVHRAPAPGRPGRGKVEGPLAPRNSQARGGPLQGAGPGRGRAR
jgi:hypothetical protein